MGNPYNMIEREYRSDMTIGKVSMPILLIAICYQQRIKKLFGCQNYPNRYCNNSVY